MIFDVISGIIILVSLKVYQRLFVYVVIGENKIKIRMVMQGNLCFRIVFEL